MSGDSLGNSPAAADVRAGANTDNEAALGSLESMSAISSRLERLSVENEQLADEVLRNYEQLSLMFDFATRISGVTHATAMAELLFDRCAALLGVKEVYVIGFPDDWRCYSVREQKLRDARPAGAPADLLESLVDEARADRVVTVRATDAVQLAAAPLEFSNTAAVVVALRDNSLGEFASGELRLLESLLTFGGQLLNNSVLHERLRRLSMEAMRALVSAIDKKDNYTCGHSERVGFFARMIGERLGLPSSTLDQLEWAGLLHDVGKIGISEEVLNKPGRLTAEEFAHIQQHPRMGYEILEPIQSFADVRGGVLYHHENMNGSGYPEGLKAEEIPLFARIIHVVDVFDAMSSRRSYRNAIAVDRVLEIMREEAGPKLDEKIAAMFMEFVDEFRSSQPDAFAAMFRPSALTEET